MLYESGSSLTTVEHSNIYNVVVYAYITHTCYPIGQPGPQTPLSVSVKTIAKTDRAVDRGKYYQSSLRRH